MRPKKKEEGQTDEEEGMRYRHKQELHSALWRRTTHPPPPTAVFIVVLKRGMVHPPATQPLCGKGRSFFPFSRPAPVRKTRKSKMRPKKKEEGQTDREIDRTGPCEEDKEEQDEAQERRRRPDR